MSTVSAAPTENPPPAIVGLVAAVHGRVTGVAELALAEAKLAAISVALMVFAALIAAGFVLAAWGLALAGIVSGLLMLEVPLWASLIGLGALHAILATIVWRTVLSLSNHLEFSATRAQLRSTSGAG